ncbi:MAG: RluA family pseudouridine synthase [Bacteroidetes bacterium]|nr:RluA family pseudouridine synthase [Bacteroidota bacterium]MBP7398422.1 RluA family pseudouridine synthase [Chitinophagales bacterium]MBK7109221.1 RluA family pseudouridine synthase [Bacteroidota bacterium]MBK8488457.1 RluA family pseudouridine synthase [Bacteroidota bacterium]MBK8681780.1 RluA family pseudouridine synthase [Bacteroidota bacterium]
MKIPEEKITNPGEETEEDLYEVFRVKTDPKQEPLRIDKFLLNRIENISRTKIQNAAKAGSILVNGIVVKSNYKVKPGDEISVVLPGKAFDGTVHAENIPLNIVYEDKCIAVIDKPAGLVVHPGVGNYTGTLVNALMYHFGTLPNASTEYIRPGLVHRIDKNTSGLLVVAKEDYAMQHLAKQFFAHSIERTYHALVWGEFEEKEGTITGSIARHPRFRKLFTVTPDPEDGKHAVTHYKVLESFGYVSLVECKLETGRTHQIRVHMQYIGHPIFNDDTYGGNRIVKGTIYTKYKQFIDNCFQIIPRQALHAYSLGFIHPDTEEQMHFISPLPEDFQGAIDKWRKYSHQLKM